MIATKTDGPWQTKLLDGLGALSIASIGPNVDAPASDPVDDGPRQERGARTEAAGTARAGGIPEPPPEHADERRSGDVDPGIDTEHHQHAGGTA